MTELSENTKLRFDPSQGKIGLDPDQTRSNEPPHLEDTEAQMRRALGLFGDMSRRQDSDRSDSPQRQADRLISGGHRRRFVQDGDVPVTVVRRDSGAEVAASRNTLSTPTSSRLQRTEAALAAETTARERAERALAESQALARDFQTKIGHAELAKNEAIEALRRDCEATAAARAAVSEVEQRLREAAERIERLEASVQEAEDALADERTARKAAERALRDAETGLQAAEKRVQDLQRQQADQQERQKEVLATERQADRQPAARASSARGPATRTPVEGARATPSAGNSRRSTPKVTVSPEPELEPEPVKWWLMTKPAPKRR